MDASEFRNVLSSCQHSDEWDEAVSEMKYKQNCPVDCELIKELSELGYKVQGEDGYGGEGKGDQYWVVFCVEKDSEKTFFKLDGWYSSYNGSSFDDYHDFYAVKKVPVEKFEWHQV